MVTMALVIGCKSISGSSHKNWILRQWKQHPVASPKVQANCSHYINFNKKNKLHSWNKLQWNRWILRCGSLIKFISKNRYNSSYVQKKKKLAMVNITVFFANKNLWGRFPNITYSPLLQSKFTLLTGIESKGPKYSTRVTRDATINVHTSNIQTKSR